MRNYTHLLILLEGKIINKRNAKKSSNNAISNINLLRRYQEEEEVRMYRNKYHSIISRKEVLIKGDAENPGSTREHVTFEVTGYGFIVLFVAAGVG